MKTESKALDKCQVELAVSLDADEAKKLIRNVENAFVREVRIPGFRPGKAPLALVKKNFADGIKDEIRRAVVERNVYAAIEAEKLATVAVVDVKDITCDENGAGFTAIVEVKPTVKLPEYKGVKIAPANTTVEDAAVQERVEAIRTAYSKFEDAKEGEIAADGDFVQIDYSGTVDGKPITDLAPEAKIVASGIGFWTQIEEGRFLPEILDAVKGMKTGETKNDVKAKFNPDAAPEGLKGVEAVYTVTLKAFRRRVKPTDSELVEKAKVESIEKLVADTRAAMEKRQAEAEEARRENEAAEALLKGADFAVPGSQVRRATDGMLAEFAERAQYSGLNADYFEKNRDKILADAETNATRQVRFWYIAEAIAKAENIEAKSDELGKKVIEFVLANSVA